MPIYMMNMCVKFHLHHSTKQRDIASHKTDVNEQKMDRQTDRQTGGWHKPWPKIKNFMHKKKNKQNRHHQQQQEQQNNTKPCSLLMLCPFQQNDSVYLRTNCNCHDWQQTTNKYMFTDKAQQCTLSHKLKSSQVRPIMSPNFNSLITDFTYWPLCKKYHIDTQLLFSVRQKACKVHKEISVACGILQQYFWQDRHSYSW